MKRPQRKELPPCDREVFEKGETIAILAGVKSADMESWIVNLRDAVGDLARVDWHYAAGRAVVKAIGNGKIVAQCIATLGLPAGATT